MSKHKLIVANWKANPLSLVEAKKTAKKIILFAKKYPQTSVVICAPFIYLEPLLKLQKEQLVVIGAQNAYSEDIGSYTGEVTPDMLKQLGIKEVILGHSERRAMGETDDVIARKVSLVLAHHMNVILCIGEKEHDQGGNYLSFIRNQLLASLGKINPDLFGHITIAYEPLWAIGKTDADAMKGADMHEMLIFIQKTINDAFGAHAAKKVKILYGGSVSKENAKDILENGYVDGLLIGRQSLYPENFAEIIKIASELK